MFYSENRKEFLRIINVIPSEIFEYYTSSMVFWVGDLNYRLNDISNESVKQLVAKKEYTKLMQYDQVSSFVILLVSFSV